jgi:hypothetical protein
MKPKWDVYAVTKFKKYIGEVEANGKAYAEVLGYDLPAFDTPNLCHHCSSEAGNAGDPTIIVERQEEDGNG